MKNLIKSLYSPIIDQTIFQKIFEIYITKLRQSFYLNENAYIKLLEKKIVFDIFRLSTNSPHQLDKYFNKKEKKFIIKNYIDTIYYFYCDIKNFLQLLKGIFLKKNIIISSERWVKNKDQYEKEILSNFENEVALNYIFIYFQVKSLEADNKLIINLREKVYKIFIDNFESFTEKYQSKMKNIYGKKIDYLICENNLRNIKIILQNNFNNNSKFLNLYSFSYLFSNIYSLLSYIVDKFSKKKNLYIINTHSWVINNFLIENILLKRHVELIGCQHGGNYNESVYPYCDYEIYCPSISKFIGFGLFKHKINSSLILNLQDSYEKGLITYITGPYLNQKSLNINQIKTINIIKKLSINYKYNCSIRVHPKVKITDFKKSVFNNFKEKNELKKVLIFQASSKNKGISNFAKICIFDFPHSTLFWDAYYKDLKTVLIYDTKNKNISEKYLNLFNLIIEPRETNWENDFCKLIE